MEKKIIQAMQDLGFTATDAKAYLGLLKNHPATGYELATRTGVPRSAIYNVVRRLEAQGLINSVQAKPARYQPLPPERLFAQLESRFSQSLSEFKNAVNALKLETDSTATWTMRGYSTLIEQARTLIKEAQQSLVLSLWESEAEQLQDRIQQASKRGVDVVLFSFTPLPKMGGTRFSYQIPATKLAQYWTPKLIIVADHRRLLVGSAERNEDSRAALSEEQSLIEMALSNLVLDITLFGQRSKRNVSEVIAGMTAHMAPIDELVRESLL